MTREEILLRFEGLADRVIPASLFGGWPPPQRLFYDPTHDRFHIAEDFPEPPDGLTVYHQVRRSELTDEQIAEMTHVVRGAEYQLEASDD